MSDYPLSKDNRDRLKALAVVADIQNDVRLAEYHKLAVALQAQADVSYRNGSLEQAYVDYYKMFSLVGEKIPKHNAYGMKQYASEKAWFLKARNDAFVKIELIVRAFEERERQRLHQMELDLIDEFDSEPVTPSGSSTEMASTESSCQPETISVEKAFSLLRLQEARQQQHRPVSVFAGPTAARAMGSPAAIPGATGAGRAHTTGTSGIASTLSNDTAINQVLLGPIPLLNTDELDILRTIGDFQRISIPSPISTVMEIFLGRDSYVLCQDDFHVSFSLFLFMISPRLQISDVANETNRCFFVHLGVAMGIHPFALQCAFRVMAKLCIPVYQGDFVAQEILETVLQRAGFVDAQLFLYLWPSELYNARLCFISGESKSPIISVFESPTEASDPSRQIEIIVRCEHGHFTLVRPITKVNANARTFSFLDKFISDAASHGSSIQSYKVAVSRRWSIAEVLKKMLQR